MIYRFMIYIDDYVVFLDEDEDEDDLEDFEDEDEWED